MSITETKEFYDEFSQSVMLKYFRQVNARLEGVKELCDRNIQDEAKILEVGCGVGILTKHLQKRASQIVSVDISETGLTIARDYAHHTNTDFYLLNVLENSVPLEKYGFFDAIVVADVIEHIPKEEHQKFFRLLEGLLSTSGVIILTFPSSQHQVYLTDMEPDKLQIIDEIVFVREILAATNLWPFAINYFDADGENKYIHLVLRANIDYTPNKLTDFQKFVRRVRNILWAAKNRGFVKSIQNKLSAN
jgi:cyclopropane fatty-acyl-phospholipid synthase-like methyltransferase